MNTTKENSKNNSARLGLVKILAQSAPRFATVCLASLLFLSLNGCVTKAQVDALVWLNNLTELNKLCPSHPELKDYGFYRKLNDGKLEFISVCNPLVADLLSMQKGDYNNLMQGLVPKP